MKFDLHYLLTPKYAKWIIIILISLFSILIFIEFATLFFLQPHPVIALEKAPVEKKQDLLSSILNIALFGIYVPENLSEDNVKQSMLQIKLVGIMLASKPEESHAIIRSASGEEKTYQIGDTLPGDAVLKRIMSDGIFVERDGSLERLSLPKNNLNFEPVALPLKED